MRPFSAVRLLSNSRTGICGAGTVTCAWHSRIAQAHNVSSIATLLPPSLFLCDLSLSLLLRGHTPPTPYTQCIHPRILCFYQTVQTRRASHFLKDFVLYVPQSPKQKSRKKCTNLTVLSTLPFKTCIMGFCFSFRTALGS